MHQPFLTGPTIYLRAIEENDLTDRYQQWFNDPEVCEFNSHHRFPQYRENMEAYFRSTIQSQNNLIVAIIDKASDTHVGNISLQNIDNVNRSAELAIIIGEKEFWGKGVGREACELIIDHGFRSLNLHRIYCGTAENNTGMIKLAEKIGFKNEGMAREALFKDGKYQGTIHFGLLNHEYKK